MPPGKPRRHSSFNLVEILSQPSGIHLKSFLEALDGGLQVVDAEAVGDTGLMASLLRIGIEARGRSQHHRGAIVAEIGEQPLAEFVAVVDWQVDDGVESTLRHRAETARDLIDALDDDVAARNVFVIHSIEVGLRRVDSGLGKDLTEARR